tara:strand:+ start:3109 stop:3468 length:360 start_codon:yes stop_codon:yes gene_type:complete
MSLAITGKLVKALDVESGTSKAGKEWKKQSFVIDTGAQFNPEVCFSLFGEDKIAMLQGINPGEEIEVSFNLSSREYNGRYYHNIDAWRINRAAAVVVATPSDEAPFPSQAAAEEDDLPF